MAIKPPWYISIVKRLSNYQHLVSRAKILRLEIEFAGPKTTAAYSLAPAYSGPGDSVGQLAERMVDKETELRQAEQEIRLIDTAIEGLSEEKRLIVRLRYLEGNKDSYTMLILKKEHNVRGSQKYYSLKDKAVEELAKVLGEKKGE